MSFEIDPILNKSQELHELYQSLEAEKPSTPDVPLQIVEAKISAFKDLHNKIQILSTEISSLYDAPCEELSAFQQRVTVINNLWKHHFNSWQEVRSTNFSKTYQGLALTAQKGRLANYPVIVRLNQLKADLETALNDEGISDDQINYIRDLQAQIDKTLDTERQKPQPQAPGLGQIFPEIFPEIASKLNPVSLNALACSNKHLNALANRYQQHILASSNTTLSKEEIAEAISLDRTARKSLFFQRLTQSQSLACDGSYKISALKMENGQVIIMQKEGEKPEQKLVIWDLLTNSSIETSVPLETQDAYLTNDNLFLLCNNPIEKTFNTSHLKNKHRLESSPLLQAYDIKTLKKEKDITIDFERSINTEIKFSKLKIFEDKIIIFPDSQTLSRYSTVAYVIIHDLKSNASRALYFWNGELTDIKDCVMKNNLVFLISNTHIHHFDLNEEDPDLESTELSTELLETNFTVEVKADRILLFTIQNDQPLILSIGRKSGKVSEIQKFPKEFKGTPLYFSNEGLITEDNSKLNFYPYITPTSTLVKNLHFLMETASNLSLGENFDIASLEQHFPHCIADIIAALTDIEASADAANFTDHQKVEQAIYRFIGKEIVSAFEAGYTKEALACFETLPKAIQSDVYEKLYWMIKDDLEYDYWGVGEHVFLRQSHQGTLNANRIQAIQLYLDQLDKK